MTIADDTALVDRGIDAVGISPLGAAARYNAHAALARLVALLDTRTEELKTLKIAYRYLWQSVSEAEKLDTNAGDSAVSIALWASQVTHESLRLTDSLPAPEKEPA